MRGKMMAMFALLAGLEALIPRLVMAGGDKASELVVVADTRVLDSGVMRYFANLYNENIMLFAVWAVVLTAVMGCFLGWLMDKVMSHSGLDLTSRKIVEH